MCSPLNSVRVQNSATPSAMKTLPGSKPPPVNSRGCRGMKWTWMVFFTRAWLALRVMMGGMGGWVSMSKDDGSRGGSVDVWAVFSLSTFEGAVLGACKGDRITASVRHPTACSLFPGTLPLGFLYNCKQFRDGLECSCYGFSQETCCFRFTECLTISEHGHLT